MKAGIQRPRVLADTLDDVGGLLRHDDGRLGDDDQRENGENDEPEEGAGHQFHGLSAQAEGTA